MPRIIERSTLLLASLSAFPFLSAAEVEQVEIIGREVNLIGVATSASEGRIGHQELQLRPLLRTGEVLESVPGLVATQHSGSGKANQYFLRGFNLDHGTDFSTSIDGMPVNMRSHGHGQGYTDLNFLIPELIEEISFRKGAYYKDTGDFSATGSARIATASHLEHSGLSLAAGEYGFGRLLLSGSGDVGTGSVIYGAEAQRYAGPWDQVDEDVGKQNLWLKYHHSSGDDSLSLMFMGYDNNWNSADQIPRRAVEQGLISDFGSIDPTTGGESSRYSLSLNWQHALNSGELSAAAYMIDYRMRLWSNFSYFTSPQGDQFQQIDDRRIYGGELSWQQNFSGIGIGGNNRFGAQLRIDDIDQVGLLSTAQRRYLSDIRLDRVEESSLGLYWQNTVRWTPRLRSVAGLRYDFYDFDVEALRAADPSTLEPNSGSADDGILTSSLSLIYALNDSSELYASIGQGFHSNDARGTTIALDPVTAEPVAAVDPLVDTLSTEIGLRVFLSDRWNASLALWHLDIDSELLFVGDAGNTEDTGVGSERSGVELTSYYQLNDYWSLDLEYAWTDSRFRQPLDGSEDIPGALEHVFSGGISVHTGKGFSSSLRLRHFADYPLGGGLDTDGSTMLNLRLAWDLNPRLNLTLDALNLLDSRDRDIQYYYESQLAGENAPVEDLHYHVFEPRALRLYLNYRWR